jgi:hypothetical protein
VKVKASCGEACQVVGQATLDGSGHPGDWRQVSKWYLGWTAHTHADLGPGETTTLEMGLGGKQRKVAGKVLDEGNKVRAKVGVEATDAAGNVVADAQRTIRLVK